MHFIDFLSDEGVKRDIETLQEEVADLKKFIRDLNDHTNQTKFKTDEPDTADLPENGNCTLLYTKN